ncbi:MAG: hypothetical protein AAGC73_00650 [Verrucomicrobiota bacterium]
MIPEPGSTSESVTPTVEVITNVQPDASEPVEVGGERILPEAESEDAALPIIDSGKTLTLEAAKAQIQPEIVAALEKHFNGEIVSVRKTDERDLIF